MEDLAWATTEIATALDQVASETIETRDNLERAHIAN